MRATSLLIATACLAAAAARAEPTADTLCPILAKVAAEAQADAQIPEAAVASLVIDVGSAYDFDGDTLRQVLAEADAATSAGCPDARAAVLKATGKPSLADAMR